MSLKQIGMTASILLFACEGKEMMDSREKVGMAPAVSAQGAPAAAQTYSHNDISSIDGEVQGVSPAPAPAAVPTPTPAPAPVPVAEELPETAIAPIVVGGAFLKCTMVPAQAVAACKVTDAAGTPSTIVVEKAYMISGNPATWTETTFRKGATVGAYFVDVPKDKRNDFGVSMLFEKQKAVFDWVLEKGLSAFNQVRDGSFEALPTDKTIENSGFTNDKSPIWKTRLVESNGCNDGYSIMEVQTDVSDDKVAGYDGRQWVELDSNCSDYLAVIGGNYALYQDLKLDPKRFYMIRFVSKRRPNDTELQKMKVNFGGKAIFEKDTTSTTWLTTSLVATTAQANVRLEFEEMGKSNLSGTLIDTIQVIDLGLREQSISVSVEASITIIQ